MPNLPEKTLSIQEAAELLKVTTKTLRRWEASGLLVPARTTGGHRRYLLSQIQDLKGERHGKVTKRRLLEIKGAPLSYQEFEPTKLSAEDLKRSFAHDGPVSKKRFISEFPVLLSKLAKPQRRLVVVSICLFIITLTSTLALKTNLPEKVNSLFAPLKLETSQVGSEVASDNFPKGLVLAESTSANDITFKVTVDSGFEADVDISGILNLSGNSLTSSDDLSIDPVGDDATLGGNLILSDTFTLSVGGGTGTAYSEFANATEGPENAAIAAGRRP